MLNLTTRDRQRIHRQRDGEVLSHSDEFAGEDEAVFCAETNTSYVNVSLEPLLEADLNLRRGTLVV